MPKSYKQYQVPMSDAEDARLREVAGPGNLGAFIRESVLMRIDNDDYEVVDDEADQADAPTKVF